MTAVEWFAQQLGITNGTMLEQAKQMEHEQICEAYGKQFIMKLDGKYDWFTGEEYYENKYGQLKIKDYGKDTSENVQSLLDSASGT